MEAESHLLDRYSALHSIANRVPRRVTWLATRRIEALNRFLLLGFPTTRDEEWRFTSVAPIADTYFVPGPPSPAVHVDPFRLPGLNGTELVFVNGQYVPALSNVGSLPPGVRVESLAPVVAEVRVAL